MRQKALRSFEIALVLVRCDHVASPHRKRESRHHASGCRIWRDRLYCWSQRATPVFVAVRFVFSIQTAQSKGSFRSMKQNETMTDAMICYTCGLRNGV